MFIASGKGSETAAAAGLPTNYALMGVKGGPKDLFYWANGHLTALSAPDLAIACAQEPAAICPLLLRRPLSSSSSTSSYSTEEVLVLAVADRLLFLVPSLGLDQFSRRIALPRLPDCPPLEFALWQSSKSVFQETGDFSSLRESLAALDRPSARACYFLDLPSDKHRQAFLARGDNVWDCMVSPFISCCKALSASASSPMEPEYLVVAVAEYQILVLEPSEFTAVRAICIPAQPIFLSVTGTFATGFRVYVACADDRVYLWKHASGRDAPLKSICLLPDVFDIFAIEHGGGVCVVTADCITKYRDDGSVGYAVTLPSAITAACPMFYAPKNFSGIIVATEDARIRVFSGPDLVYASPDKANEIAGSMENPILVALYDTFGSSGDDCLVTVRKNGMVNFAMLSRRANFAATPQKLPPMPEPSPAFLQETLSHVSIENAEREKADPSGVYQNTQFYKDIVQLKIAEAYKDTLTRAAPPPADAAPEPIVEREDKMPPLWEQVQVDLDTRLVAVDVHTLTLSLDTSRLVPPRDVEIDVRVVPSSPAVSFKKTCTAICASRSAAAVVRRVFQYTLAAADRAGHDTNAYVADVYLMHRGGKEPVLVLHA